MPVILSGGTGTRLWPSSRKSLPKQFINFAGQSSLFTQTLKRAKHLSSTNKAIIISSKNYGFLCHNEVSKTSMKAEFILEEIGRNTAPAIYFASKLAFENDEKSILCFMPSDHWIEDISAFSEMIYKSISLAKNDNWVTFGIKPLEPVTGYGYINSKKISYDEYSFHTFS